MNFIKSITLLFFLIIIDLATVAQVSVGPRSITNLTNTATNAYRNNINFPTITSPVRPSSVSGNASPGSVNWLKFDSCAASDNLYAVIPAIAIPLTASSSTQKRESRLMYHRDFGFTINPSLFIQGIEVEYEKVTTSSDVAFNNTTTNWDTGFYYSPVINAARNRALVFAMALENGGGLTNRLDILNVDFANQTMVLRQDLHVTSASNAFNGRIEVYTLDDQGIANALSSGLPLKFNVTYNTPPVVLTEDVRVPISAMFNNVDQTFPFTAIQANGVDAPPSTGSGMSATTAYQLATPLATNVGGVAVIVGMAGTRAASNPAPNTTNVSFNTIPGYTGASDIYSTNPSCCSNSGCSFFCASKFTTTVGTEQPTLTFLGAANRQLIVAFQLQRARELDRNVYLVMGNKFQDVPNIAFPTSNAAKINVAWPTSDTYIKYGGPNDKWGQIAGYYTVDSINSKYFGSCIGVTVLNGAAKIDHVRITIYTSTTLPIDLLSFTGALQNNTDVLLNWETITEINNKVFDLERSIDGENFSTITQIDGAGNANELLKYSYTDKNLAKGTYYYRLKQTDFDGQFSYSAILAQNVENGIIPSVRLFPNPSPTGIFSTISNVSLENNNYAVYNSELKLIETNNNISKIDLSAEPDGTYYFIQQVGDSKIIQKLMKFSKGK